MIEIPVWQRGDGVTLALVDGRWHYVGYTKSEFGGLERAAKRIGAAIRRVTEYPTEARKVISNGEDAPKWGMATHFPALDPRTL